MPQLIRMSSPPKRDTANATAASASADDLTSPAQPSAWRPSDRNSAAASCTSAARRPITTSLAPCLPSCRAISSPMPDVPPVMSATCNNIFGAIKLILNRMFTH